VTKYEIRNVSIANHLCPRGLVVRPLCPGWGAAPGPELSRTVHERLQLGTVGQLTKGLSITRTQARGGAGALFALAKSRLSAEEFSKVSAAVPGMNGLLKAAPAVPEPSELSSLESSLPGGMGRMAEAAEAFHKLGLSPEMAGRFVPVMTKFVESKGGLSTASLLEKALK
jgi:Protein of unknown function VcgC/VcgE (DUF2780)